MSRRLATEEHRSHEGNTAQPRRPRSNELRGSGILVHAADPGFVATDLHTHSGVRTVAQGAGIAVRLATLAEGGPTGAFLEDDGPVP